MPSNLLGMVLCHLAPNRLISSSKGTFVALPITLISQSALPLTLGTSSYLCAFINVIPSSFSIISTEYSFYNLASLGLLSPSIWNAFSCLQTQFVLKVIARAINTGKLFTISPLSSPQPQNPSTSYTPVSILITVQCNQSFTFLYPSVTMGSMTAGIFVFFELPEFSVCHQCKMTADSRDYH